MSKDDNQKILPPETPENQLDEIDPSLAMILESEKRRVDSHNRRIELGHKMIEVQDASDQRQYDYSMKQLNANAAQSERRDGFPDRQGVWRGQRHVCCISCYQMVPLPLIGQ